MKINKDILTGVIGLGIISTLLWSLNRNFGFVESTWLEVFGVTTIVFMILATFFVRK